METPFVGLLLITSCLCASLSDEGRLDRVEILLKDALNILSQHQDDLIKMETKLNQQDEIIQDLQKDSRYRVENLFKDALTILSQHQDVLIKMETKLNQQDEIIQDLQKDSRSKRQSSIVVAFTSKVSHPLVNLTNNEVIKFDKEITNVGGAYFPTTGEFICPVNGLYEFAAAIGSAGNGNAVEIEMVRDGQSLITIHATGYAHDTGTSVVIIECIEGQAVWVRHVAGKSSNATMAGNSFFSGHLIHAD